MQVSLAAKPLLLPSRLAAIAADREFLTTNEAALALNRKSQTLRKWSMGAGPILPIRINGRLGWRVADIARLLEGGSQ